MTFTEKEIDTAAKERYADLCEYFGGDKNLIESILHDRNEFRKWLERMRWHIQECNKLYDENQGLKDKLEEG